MISQTQLSFMHAFGKELNGYYWSPKLLLVAMAPQVSADQKLGTAFFCAVQYKCNISQYELYHGTQLRRDHDSYLLMYYIS